MDEAGQGALDGVPIYDDILEWLDMVEALGAPLDGSPMQYGLRPEILAAEAYGIEDGRDGRAFAAAWGELADDWCAWDLTGGRG